MGELIVFVIFAPLAVVGALTMVASRNPVHSAMGLLMTLFSVAVFYVSNNGHFIAAVQVIVYAGAIMTLFLFVIMLIGVDSAEDAREVLPNQRPIAIALGLALLGLVLAAGSQGWVPRGTGAEVNGTIENVSDALFGAWILPFEVTSLLLIIASVGTIALAQFRPRAIAGDEVDESAIDEELV